MFIEGSGSFCKSTDFSTLAAIKLSNQCRHPICSGIGVYGRTFSDGEFVSGTREISMARVKLCIQALQKEATKQKEDASMLISDVRIERLQRSCVLVHQPNSETQSPFCKLTLSLKQLRRTYFIETTASSRFSRWCLTCSTSCTAIISVRFGVVGRATSMQGCKGSTNSSQPPRAKHTRLTQRERAV